ncbi:hypothetical protein N7448_010552 [Penicillium atrosanguineum]|uniref:Uncharacterized protein n=1 Tax=Penicillium atrosanguineum TaxID=1132637 RepID=A0A9W9U1D7_9EURO|nr:MFS maltose permease MalP [Penicillium atrosanguineum]KAJ5119883.1 hypothetical protein N7448_010552 [Penicillium atrosanguineum]KAJ5296884.1 MFS maltose permease MalP [Penicillium atrosanguineum]KAJ5299645.1 hypothetical protein N7476_011202 [Penicillium atrosanguineum]
MKSFAIAAFLASTVAALPTGTSTFSCIPSSAAPTGFVPEIPYCSSTPTAMPTVTPTPKVSGLSSFTGGSSAGNAVHSVFSVTNGGKKMLVELEQGFAQKLTGLNLGSVTDSIGSILDIADSPSQLNTNSLTSGVLTVATTEGKYALVQLTSEVETLLSPLLSTLGGVTQVVGGLVGTLEGLGSLANLKRDPISDVMSITGMNGNNILVQVEPTVLGLLGELNLGSLLGGSSSQSSPLGSVVGEVPVAGDLVEQATSLGADPTQLIGVLSKDGSSALLVKVESTATGLLSTLGLSSLGQTVGSVVSSTPL